MQNIWTKHGLAAQTYFGAEVKCWSYKLIHTIYSEACISSSEPKGSKSYCRRNVIPLGRYFVLAKFIFNSILNWQKVTIGKGVTLYGRLWNWYGSVNLRSAIKHTFICSFLRRLRKPVNYKGTQDWCANILRYSCSSINSIGFHIK